MTIIFDKLAMVKRLEQGDAFTRPQAETLAEALNASLAQDMVGRAELQAELRVQEASLKLWTGQLAVGLFVTLGGLMTFLRFFHGN